MEKVLIIGAGVAGLAAAGELARAGLRPVVLEARSRVGGRIHTLTTGDGPPVELGAEFLHGLSPEVERLACELHLAKREISDEHWKIQCGDFEALPAFWDKLAEVFDKIPEHGRDRSYADFAATLRGVEAKARNLTHDFVEGFHAADPRRISVQSIAQSEAASEEIEGTKQFRLVAGYGELVRALHARAVAFGARVLLRHAAARVEWRRGHVRVSARGGDDFVRFDAAAVVVTLPIGVLQRGSVNFDPPLPAQQKAIASLAMGNVVKVNFSLRPGLWPEDKPGFIHLATPSFPTWWKKRNVITAWVGGPKADQHGSPPEIMNAAMDALTTMFGQSARPFMESAQFHDWRRDPFAAGAYSYVPVGGLQARDVLARPVQRTVFFAGEATAKAGFQGTVHGAIESGLRVANEVLGR